MTDLNKIITGTTLRLVLVIFIALMGTFLSDVLGGIDFFGDTFYTNSTDFHNKGDIIWSARHKWYVAAMAILFLGGVANVIAYFYTAVTNYGKPTPPD